MHQHPRPPPPSASPANSERTNPTRTNNSRDRDTEPGTRQLQGLGIQEALEAPADQTATQSANDVSRLNQVIQNFHTKAALIILHSRAELTPAYSKGSSVKRVNKWFNVELDETEDYKDEIRPWKTCDAADRRPPPLIIEIYLDTSDLGRNQTLVVIDEQNKRWDVMEMLAVSGTQRHDTSTATDEVILERWTVALGANSATIPSASDLNGILPGVYKKSIVLFRSLFTFTKFLPAWKLTKRLSAIRANSQLKLRYRILGSNRQPTPSRNDSLTMPLFESDEKVANDYYFGSTDSPAGPFSVKVTYRNSCEFRVDDAEALLSSQLLGSDTELFKPSLPRDESMQQVRQRVGAGGEAGSLPVKNPGLYDHPDRSQAYGSLSTFHQLGAGTSPITALRTAQDFGSESLKTSPPTRTVQGSRSNQSSRPSIRQGEQSSTGRRPSVTFQAFKAGSLSSSPAPVPPTGTSPRPSQAGISALSALKEARGMPPPAVPASKSASKTVETVPGSASSSPKPAPVTRYSSSFSHRRGRWSSGGNRTDEDQNSSGKASATSSAQRGSGQGTEKPAASSGSAQEDDENISDFLKMLESQRDLLTPSNPTEVEASNRRTTAQLNRLSQLRDSTNALSDSLSSSLHLHRSSSSSSRQLSSVPPMVAATSVSTSSSPGKPVSPHTPHTPAIPSRLSANSIIEYEPRQPDSRRHRLSHGVPASPSDETGSEQTTTQATEIQANPNAIPIPTSPRPFVPTYRRSSSVAQRRAALEDEMGDLYGNRSASMGAEERNQPLTLSALLGQPEENESATAIRNVRTGRASSPPNRPPPVSERRSSLDFRRYPPLSTTAGDGATSGSASGASSTNIAYRSRYSRGGQAGRGYGSAHGSSSSLVAANPEYSHSGSIERRGGASTRHGYGRDSKPENRFDMEDEPLLFAMSDFGASRKSLEDARGAGDAGTRRGNRGSRGGRPGSANSGGGSTTGHMPGGFPGAWS